MAADLEVVAQGPEVTETFESNRRAMKGYGAESDTAADATQLLHDKRKAVDDQDVVARINVGEIDGANDKAKDLEDNLKRIDEGDYQVDIGINTTFRTIGTPSGHGSTPVIGHTGGQVVETGIHFLAKGEEILPQHQVTQAGLLIDAVANLASQFDTLGVGGRGGGSPWPTPSTLRLVGRCRRSLTRSSPRVPSSSGWLVPELVLAPPGPALSMYQFEINGLIMGDGTALLVESEVSGLFDVSMRFADRPIPRADGDVAAPLYAAATTIVMPLRVLAAPHSDEMHRLLVAIETATATRAELWLRWRMAVVTWRRRIRVTRRVITAEPTSSRIGCLAGHLSVVLFRSPLLRRRPRGGHPRAV